MAGVADGELRRGYCSPKWDHGSCPALRRAGSTGDGGGDPRLQRSLATAGRHLEFELSDIVRRLGETPEDSVSSSALRAEADDLLDILGSIETFWAYPGTDRLADISASIAGGRTVEDLDAITGVVVGDAYLDDASSPTGDGAASRVARRPTFEVLVLGDTSRIDSDAIRRDLRALRRDEDSFTYELVFVPSLEDALIAVLVNFDIQACIVEPRFALRSSLDLGRVRHLFAGIDERALESREIGEAIRDVGDRIASLRPELDLYVLGHARLESIAGALGRRFRRIFLGRDLLELHLSILQGVGSRYQTPFFSALRRYSRRPTGVFHAMPISRGQSIMNSPWIADMAEFYGLNIFLAETSATSGGLDSLLEPAGPIKHAQTLAAARVRFAAHVLRHERHLDRQQDRRAVDRRAR